MSMSSQRFCPNCGTPLAPGQHFCPNCGTTLEAGAGDPTARAEGSGQGYASGPPEDATQLPVAPPPPPVDSYSQPPNTYYPPQAAPAAPMQQPDQQAVPSYAKPQKDSSRGVLGQIGCGVLAIILVVLLICGGASYFIYRAVSNAANSANATATAQNGAVPGTGSQNGSSPTAIAAVTAQINQTVTYASVDTTIISVQEASSFSDDTNTSSNAHVTLRINIKEHDTSTSTAFLSYSSNYLLVLPDKSTVAANNSQVSDTINQAVQRNNWLDFPLTKSIPISQLTLQIGAPTEAQISVPLTGNANLSAYQTKTITPNTTIQYEGLNWKLTQVTSSLSHKATQAKTGMRFITLAFTLDNPSSNTLFPSSSSNVRLQLGSITNSETDDTLPVTLSPGTTGSTGTVTFEMPQGSGTVTLIFLAQPNTSPPVSQQTTTFQI